MKRNFLTKIIFATLIALSALLFCACGGKPTVGVHPETVEQGMFFAVPELFTAKDYQVAVKDPDGKTVKVRNNRFELGKLGDYQIIYTVGSKTITETVKCVEDKTGPYLQNDVQISSTYYTGEYVFPQGYTLSDPSGDFYIEFEWEYYYENQTEKLNDDGSDTIRLDLPGKYKLVLRAWDLYGNESVYEYPFEVKELFIDDQIVETVQDELQYKTRADGTILLADFDDMGYANNYMSSSDSWGTSSKKYYIEDDVIDGVQKEVLRAEPYQRKTEHFVLNYQFFKPLEPVKSNGKSLGYIYIRYKINARLTEQEIVGMPSYDYLPQIYGVPYDLPDYSIFNYIEVENSSYNFNPKDGVWSLARIPVSYFTYKGSAIPGITLCICGEIFLDEIWYDSNEFVDGNRANGVLCDFDEEDYLYQITVGKIGDPADTEIFTKEEILALSQGTINVAGHDSGMLLIASKNQKNRWASAKIKLFEEIVASENTKLEFVLYYDGRLMDDVYSNLIIMNKDNENWLDGSLYVNPIDSTNGYKFYEKWVTVTVDSTVFAKAGETFDQLTIMVEGKVYLDEIRLKQTGGEG